MSYGELRNGSSSRLWGLLLAIVVHGAFIYIALLATGSVQIAQPADIKVRFLPPPPEDQIPEPPTPREDVPQDIEIKKPELTVAPARPEPPPPSPADAPDDIVDIPRQVTLIHQEKASGYTTKPRPYSMTHGLDHYPKESVRAKESGRTMLKICISETGTVESVTVAKSSGFPRLDKAAVLIGRDYRFKPALLKGKPVSACVQYGILFSLGNLHPSEPVREEVTTPEPPDEVAPATALPTNPDIGPLKSPVPIRVYLGLLSQYGVACSTTQLRVIGQDIHDGRYVIEAQCREHPNGLVVFLPLSDNVGSFEALDCVSAAKRQIHCEFATRQ